MLEAAGAPWRDVARGCRECVEKCVAEKVKIVVGREVCGRGREVGCGW